MRDTIQGALHILFSHKKKIHESNFLKANNTKQANL